MERLPFITQKRYGVPLRPGYYEGDTTLEKLPWLLKSPLSGYPAHGREQAIALLTRQVLSLVFK